MKNKMIVLAAFFMLSTFSLLTGQEASSDPISGVRAVKLVTRDDSVAYSLGLLNSRAWASDNVFPDPLVFARAIIDVRNDTPLFSDEQARSIIMSFAAELEARKSEQTKAGLKEHIEANEAFLVKNRGKQGVVETASGLQYEVVKMGTGPKPAASSTVKVHYTGTLIDGTEFDSSINKEPIEFPLSNVIPGWTEGLQLMPAGSVFRLYIPQQLGYGERGAGDVIKPYSTLIFQVELLDIVQ